jgi:hypothetical protein
VTSREGFFFFQNLRPARAASLKTSLDPAFFLRQIADIYFSQITFDRALNEGLAVFVCFLRLGL